MTETNKNNELPTSVWRKRGSVLRLTVFRKFEVFGFVAGLVVKIPACAKPRPVKRNLKKQTF